MDERYSRRRVSRRAFLGVVGTAVAGSAAGCVATQPSTDEPSGQVAEEHLPASEFAETEFRGGLERRGVSPEATVPDDPEIAWTVREVNTAEHNAAKASPVATPDGDVVVPGDTGELRRVTPDGEVLWRSSVEETTRGIHGTPAIANGTVYIGAYDGALYAFDLASGDRIWRSKLGDAIGSSPGYYDGTVYIAVEYYDPSGAMYAVDAVDGEVVWDDQRPTSHPHSTCAIDRDAGRLVVGCNDGNLYGWSYPDLDYQWAYETDGDIKGPIATYDGSAFFGSWDNTVYRVALDDGSGEWTFEPDSDVMTGPSIEPETGRLYVGSHDTNLYALAIDTGEELWSFDTDGYLIGCPTVTSERVLVGSWDQHLYAVDKETGDGVWDVEGVGHVTCAPLVHDGAVYFTDRASQSYVDVNHGTATPETTPGTDETGALYKVVSADDG